MNRPTAVDPWNRQETAVQAIARIHEAYNEKPSGRLKKNLKRIGVTALATATVAIPVKVGVGMLEDALRQQEAAEVSNNLSPAERQAVQVGIAGMEEKLGSEAPTATTVAPEVPREEYGIQAGDTAWDIATHHLVDDEGQAFDGDPRPVIDEIQSQAGPNGILDEEDVVKLPAGLHYTAQDVHPEHRDQ